MSEETKMESDGPEDFYSMKMAGEESKLIAGAWYTDLAAAYCRGVLLPLDDLPADADTNDDATMIAAGIKAKLPYLYRFKRHEVLIPRVKELLGVVRSFGVSNILDVASQRGAFLWPLLDGLIDDTMTGDDDGGDDAPRVTAIDIDEQVLEFLSAVARGGPAVNFTAARADVTDLQNSAGREGYARYPDGNFDCVICSEILEHLSDPMEAAKEIVRVTSRLVVCTVPAQPDNNKEHIQLFFNGRPHDTKRISREVQRSQTDLRQMWLEAGARSVKVRVVHDGNISVLLAVIMK